MGTRKGRNLDYGFLDCARDMPPKYHSIPGCEFDISMSAVVDYLVMQPEIRKKIFDMANRKHVIVYDQETKTWRGADYRV